MNILKTKKGFTLIELLVVIGILAVLAAIAIPSVAGLIDRANQSADQTNANEMTNAMERFVSEYELYRQDIMSNRIDFDNLDGAQGRVYNVTGAKSIEDIEKLETDGLNGIRINIDDKYAQNQQTAKAVIENYMKTSSSSFEPKQSDLTYWYNTVTGYTVVAEKYTNTENLYKKLPQEVRYFNTRAASITEWIDLSSDFILPDLQVIDIHRIKKTNPDGSISEGLNYIFAFANPKYNDIDLNKIYYMRHSEKHNKELNMETALYCDNLGEVLSENESIKNIIDNIDKNIIEIEQPVYFTQELKEEHYDIKRQFRVAYEYEENGKIRYAYSPIFKASLDEMEYK